ncbi:RHS repeat-associated core domain-containing protein, partial [Photorhabdus akhurstii]|uniref:RHS repeat domain-containing protein n=1 Tax=Photorhabdus akhurstii TaxID=171438 RepID=UPI002F924245
EGQAPLTLERDDAGRDTGRYVEGGFILRQQYSLMGQLTAQRAGRNPHFFRPAELEEIAGPAYAGVARRYEYDAALNLTAVSDDGQPLNYLLNGNGQVMSVGEGRTLREHYQYDETGYPSRRFDGVQEIMGETLYQEGHRLNWVDSHRFVYDRAGRMQEKQFLAEGCRLALTKYRWNSQNQLTGIITPDGIPWEYRYDAFGRRIEKRCIQSGKRTTYVWDGDVPAEIREYQHGRLKMIRHLVFDGWELIAQQTQQFTLNLDNRVELMAGEVQTQYAVSAPTGEPLALFDPAGKRVWRRPKQSLYGLRLGGQAENPELDPGLRFAGQLWDEESGLCYNRHRFYSPEAACYLSPDPIGLVGGLNPYSYVQNPTGWIDPLGLAPCPTPPDKINLTKDGVKHVKDRHVGDVKGWSHKSKWTLNNADVKSTIRDVFRKPDRIIRDGDRFIYEKTLKRNVGITPEGEILNKVRVVTESNGDLVTAFPQSVFKDLKPTDVIF